MFIFDDQEEKFLFYNNGPFRVFGIHGSHNYSISLNFCPLCKKPLRLIFAILHPVCRGQKLLKEL